MQIKTFLILSTTLLTLSSATLVQIGFDRSLNWDFVSSNPQSAAQISQFLPQGVAFDLGIGADQVAVQRLQALDTTNELGYVTTLALFNLDDALVDQLRRDIVIASSPLYNNLDSIVHDLVSRINPSIPLVA